MVEELHTRIYLKSEQVDGRIKMTKSITRSNNETRLDEINSQKGASIWVTKLPLKEEEFIMDKAILGIQESLRKKTGSTRCM